MDTEIKFTTDAMLNGTIKTIDDLIREAKIDLDVWEIIAATINKWDSAAKSATTGEMVTTPLFQVKLSLIPRLTNFLQPAQGLPADHVIFDASQKAGKPVETAVFLPDMQIGYKWNDDFTYLEPFHDRQAIDCALQFIADTKPQHIVLLGDILDLPSISRFASSSDHHYMNVMQASIEETYYILRTIRNLSSRSKIYFVVGNHDARLEKFLNTVKSELNTIRAAQEMRPALSIAKLLRLDELNIEILGGYDTITWLWDTIAIRHGEEVNPKVDKITHTTVHGHLHRIHTESRTILSPCGPRVISLVSPGCLCRTDGTVPAYSKNVNWQHGIAIAYCDTSVESSRRQEYIQAVPIINGRMFYGMKEYNAQNPGALATRASLATGIKQFVLSDS